MTRQPQTRADLLREMQRRLDLAAQDGSQIIMLEPLELAGLVKPELARMDNDPQGTGEIVMLDFGKDTQLHQYAPVRITGPEQFVSSLDCNAATEEINF